MWYYTKKLEHPVRVERSDPRMAKLILSQYGGPQGELAAATRYLTHRFTMPEPRARATLIDIGTEEFAHLEVLGELFEQLIDGVPLSELRRAGLDTYYVEHGRQPFYVNSDGVPFTEAYVNATGDPIANMHEDIAAEERARAVYEHLIAMTDDVHVKEALRFLWSREVVHADRFRESLQRVTDYLNERRVIRVGEYYERSNRLGRLTWRVDEIRQPRPTGGQELRSQQAPEAEPGRGGPPGEIGPAEGEAMPESQEPEAGTAL
ncbi:manganese catalase family protein [Limnochorda pilosa]|uniref:CotJC n=1 Tax=Limnochorda pilosa TaxID=1555112 RepID=A0A0K2SNF9_LIMPI|nr:manganese catalase family protein [Limnochorda pilosa]BAS28369.1 CotJC [Limnochorda pilosa]